MYFLWYEYKNMPSTTMLAPISLSYHNCFYTSSPCRWFCLAQTWLSTKKKTIGLLFILFGLLKLINLWEFETLSKKTKRKFVFILKVLLKCYLAKKIHYSSLLQNTLLINCKVSLFYFKVTFVKNLMPTWIRCLFLKLCWELDALRHPQLANKVIFQKLVLKIFDIWCIWCFSFTKVDTNKYLQSECCAMCT